eukprot:74520-Chlamydomonas_euryale.AAC.1
MSHHRIRAATVPLPIPLSYCPQAAREYLDPIRECYEAFVIYNFYAFLMVRMCKRARACACVRVVRACVHAR